MDILYFLITILSAHSVNFHCNEFIPIDFHIDKEAPQGVVRSTTILCSDIYDTYSTNDQSHKIGNVLYKEKYIYEDSCVLDYRRVLMKTNRNGIKILMIYSIYSDSAHECREVVEFKMPPGGEEYTEIVRTPIELDIKDPNKRFNSPIVEIRYPNRNYFKISKNLRESWVIGMVKYGDMVIDDSEITVTYKEAVKSFEFGQEIISIWKRTKDGHNIRTRYAIVEENGSTKIDKLEENVQRMF